MKKVLLLILDGWGINVETKHNPIAAAQPPYWNSLLSQYPTTRLSAREAAVGVPKGCLSNSEIGHTAIGAGRVVLQSAFAIDKAIGEKRFDSNPVLAKTAAHIKKYDGILHIVGMLSSGGVHSHVNHLSALTAWAHAQNLSSVALHLLLDGRDMPPMSAIPLIEKIQKQLPPEINIVSLCGRATGMDRTENWDRTLEFYTIITLSTDSDISNLDPISYIQRNYKENITDEFIAPARFSDERIKKNDAVVFFNFRADRMRQLAKNIHRSCPAYSAKKSKPSKQSFFGKHGQLRRHTY